jgi:fucose permease
LKGFQKDTGLTADQYELAISIFFVGYIIMQVPSNFLLNYINRPSWFLGGATALWGVVSLCGG